MTLIKALCSDFVVRELDAQHTPLTIHSLACPLAEQFRKFEQFLDPGFKMAEIDFHPLDEHKFSAEQLENLSAFLIAQYSGSKLVLPASESKDFRSRFYAFLNDLALPTLEAKTVNGQYALCFHEKVKPMRIPVREKYLHFTLKKQNIDTQTALSLLHASMPFYARYFKLSDFSYAGIKDKRAITFQRICVMNKDAWPGIFAAAAAKCGLELGDFAFSDERIDLGSHCGNEFEICLRNIQNVPEAISRAKSVMQRGFPNKFGPQRFGTCSIKTDYIGLFLLKEDFVSAFKAIVLAAIEVGKHDEDIAGTTLGERFQSASRLMAEKKAFSRLAWQLLAWNTSPEDANACEAALAKLSRNQRTLYFHALQSRVFNAVTVEERLQIGDIVENGMGQVELVTEANVAQFTVYDRVAPLVGFDSLQKHRSIFESECKTVKYVKEQLAYWGVRLEDINEKHRDFIAPGGWRKLQNTPVHITACLMQHEGLMDEFPLDSRYFGELDAVYPTATVKYQSLLMKFCLPASVYATELIAFVLGEAYSVEAQKKLMIELQESDDYQ